MLREIHRVLKPRGRLSLVQTAGRHGSKNEAMLIGKRGVIQGPQASLLGALFKKQKFGHAKFPDIKFLFLTKKRLAKP